MSRPRSDNPKEHTSIIRAKRKDGWTYIQRVVSVYDPKIKNSRRISTETLGKLPPGETDLEKLVTLEPRRRKGSLQAAKIAAPAQEVIDPRDPGRIIYPLDIVFCVILLAAMQGKTSCTEIAEFWHQLFDEKFFWFCRNGVPQVDVGLAVRRCVDKTCCHDKHADCETNDLRDFAHNNVLFSVNAPRFLDETR